MYCCITKVQVRKSTAHIIVTSQAIKRHKGVVIFSMPKTNLLASVPVFLAELEVHATLFEANDASNWGSSTERRKSYHRRHKCEA